MSMTIRQTILSTLIAVAAFAAAPEARAQGNPFAAAIRVNDRAITNFEIAQRKLFLGALRQPGNVDELAVEQLIDDRIKLDAAATLGISLAPDDLEAGMAEFAGRANLSKEEFLGVLANEGVAPDTFRSFVEAGIIWREVVRTRFGPRVQVSDAEIDRALALASRQAGVQVLISEIVLPADSPQASEEADRVARRLAGSFISEGAFAAEAQARSVSPTRDRGGRYDWLPLANLPPPVAAQVIGLAPGQVSQPFPVQGAVVLFYLRDLRETGRAEARTLALEWAEFSVASLEEAQRVKGEVDTCDDLYGVAKGLPEERLTRTTLAAGEVPSDLALDLARLDENEASAQLRAGIPVLLMLCGRTYELAEGEGASREEIRNRLFNQRLTSYSDGYLAELKADATIRYE